MRMMRKFFLLAMAFSLLGSGMLSCTGKDQHDYMLFPNIVTVDFPNNRVFVIDNRNNVLNLIDPTTDEVVPSPEDSKEPLLDADGSVLLPEYPSNGVVASLEGGLSRLFVVGPNPGPDSAVVVLDYDNQSGLVTSPISPIVVPGTGNDVLVGLAVDPVRNRLFVSDATTGAIHIFSVLTGEEDPLSPLVPGGQPGNLAIDLESDLLAVADSTSSWVSFYDLGDLDANLSPLEVGLGTRAVALASNASGTVLFLSGAEENIALAYVLDVNDPAQSNQIFSLGPPAPQDPLPDPLFLTGNLNQGIAGNLSNGNMAAFFTQSSGDLLALDLSSDLETLTPAIVSVGAVLAEGIAGFPNALGQITKVYYTSVGLGVLTVVDPLTNEFTDQIP